MPRSDAHQIWLRRLLPWVGAASILSVWELLSVGGVLPRTNFPPAHEVFLDLVQKIGDSGYWVAVMQTLWGWAAGLMLTVLLAVPAGILVGTNEIAYRATHAVVEFLRPIPSVALVPLAILLYGRGFQTKLFLVTFAAFWPLFVQTAYGVRDVDPKYLEMARSFRVSGMRRLLQVRLQGASPYIATGLRISSAVALVLTVTAELIVGSPGVGNEVQKALSGSANTSMYAFIVTAGLIGWALNRLIESAEGRLLIWHPMFRKAA